jgi:hypothetical protein
VESDTELRLTFDPYWSCFGALGCIAFPVKYLRSDPSPASSVIPPSSSSSELNADTVRRVEFENVTAELAE